MKRKSLGLNQLRILHALMDGPLDGLYKGPRPVESVIDVAIPWLPLTKPKKKLSQKRGTRQTRAAQAMKRLVADGLVRCEKLAVNNKGERRVSPQPVSRNYYTVTAKGIEEYKKQTDPAYRQELVRREREAVRRRKATYLPWKEVHDPELRWPRWYATMKGWKAHIEKHPSAPIDGGGWRYRIITPEGATSAWKSSDIQEKGPTRRKVEVTLRSLVAERAQEAAPEDSEQD